MKRSLLVEGHGRPLAAMVAAANVPDDRLLKAMIDAMVIERPQPEPDWSQHLAIDAAYDTTTGWETTLNANYYPHIAPRRGPAATARPAVPRSPRVVEHAYRWLANWRAILVRWERKVESYLGIIELACALLRGRYYLQLAPSLHQETRRSRDHVAHCRYVG